ncbi:MAG: FG-GAP-like repeat-containing protein [Thermoanaerobaculia bacterium]
MKRLLSVIAAVLIWTAPAPGRAATCSSRLFVEAPAYPAGYNPREIVVADFNGDTLSDLAVTNPGGYSVSVLLGNGDGTFGPPIAASTDYNPQGLDAGDFDGNGDVDLAVGSNSAVSILIGNGDGTFQPPASYSAGNGYVYSVKVAQLDTGGTLDVILTTEYTGSVYVLLGDGDGTFGAATAFPAGGASRDIALGDFDEDGALDVVAAHHGGNTVSLLLGGGDGTLFPPLSFAAGTAPTYIESGDFDGNGHLDVAVTTQSYMTVLLGNGGGSFGAALQYPAGPSPGPFVVGDFDADGVLDLAIVQEGGQEAVLILRGDGDGGFSLSDSYLAAGAGAGIADGDFNGDGLPDLAVSNSGAGTVSILIANGNGRFAAGRNIATSGGVRTIAKGDFDGDGIPDLAVSEYQSVGVLLGDGTGGFEPFASYSLESPAGFVITADFTNDGTLDLVATSAPGYGDFWFLEGNGDGTFQAPTRLFLVSYLTMPAAGDFNADGNLDVAIAFGCCGNGGITVLLGNGDGSFAPPQNIDLSRTLTALVAADLNADGKVDLAASAENDAAVVLLGNGDGTFQSAVQYPVQDNPRFLASGDIDGDGDLDLVVANNNSQNLSVLRGNGDGTFAPGPTIGLGLPVVFVAIYDLNEDGLADLLTANDNGGSISVFTGIGGGFFASPVEYDTGSNAVFAVIGDFDRNGHPDVAVASTNTGSITVLLNSRLGVAPLAPAGACAGSAGTLTAHASGFGPLSFQWRKDGVDLADGGNISGATTATLTIDPATAADEGSYDVVVTDSCTTVTSNAVSFTVDDPPAQPVISTVASAAPGVPAAASVSGTPGHTYAWTVTGATITSGQGTNAIEFVAALPGTVTINVVDYAVPGCGTAAASVQVPVDYLDVPPSHPFHADIVTLAQAGITAGCGGGNYCPALDVTRAQMAVFLLKAKLGATHVPPVQGPYFADVPPGSFAADWINELYNLGITTGCGFGNYCPNANVTRAQMAVFLLKTLIGNFYDPPFGSSPFADVPPFAFAENFITDLYARGITGGCSASPLLYCPDNAVNRGQMAVFLVRTFLTP